MASNPATAPLAMSSDSFDINFVDREYPPEQGSIHLVSPEADLAAQPADDVLTASFAKEYAVEFTYPLEKPYLCTLVLEPRDPSANCFVVPDGSMTRDQLARFVIDRYKAIYAEEKRSKRYRIWGHDFAELFLEGVRVSRSADGKGALELWIGS